MRDCDWCGQSFSHPPILVSVKGDTFRLCSYACKTELERSPDADFSKLKKGEKGE